MEKNQHFIGRPDLHAGLPGLMTVMNIRQTTVADLAFESGISKRHINNMISGNKDCSVEMLVKLAYILNCTTDALLDMERYGAYEPTSPFIESLSDPRRNTKIKTTSLPGTTHVQSEIIGSSEEHLRSPVNQIAQLKTDQALAEYEREKQRATVIQMPKKRSAIDLIPPGTDPDAEICINCERPEMLCDCPEGQQRLTPQDMYKKLRDLP